MAMGIRWSLLLLQFGYVLNHALSVATDDCHLCGDALRQKYKISTEDWRNLTVHQDDICSSDHTGSLQEACRPDARCPHQHRMRESLLDIVTAMCSEDCRDLSIKLHNLATCLSPAEYLTSLAETQTRFSSGRLCNVAQGCVDHVVSTCHVLRQLINGSDQGNDTLVRLTGRSFQVIGQLHGSWCSGRDGHVRSSCLVHGCVSSVWEYFKVGNDKFTQEQASICSIYDSDRALSRWVLETARACLEMHETEPRCTHDDAVLDTLSVLRDLCSPGCSNIAAKVSNVSECIAGHAKTSWSGRLGLAACVHQTVQDCGALRLPIAQILRDGHSAATAYFISEAAWQQPLHDLGPGRLNITLPLAYIGCNHKKAESPSACLTNVYKYCQTPRGPCGSVMDNTLYAEARECVRRVYTDSGCRSILEATLRMIQLCQDIYKDGGCRREDDKDAVRECLGEPHGILSVRSTQAQNHTCRILQPVLHKRETIVECLQRHLPGDRYVEEIDLYMRLCQDSACHDVHPMVVEVDGCLRNLIIPGKEPARCKKVKTKRCVDDSSIKCKILSEVIQATVNNGEDPRYRVFTSSDWNVTLPILQSVGDTRGSRPVGERRPVHGRLQSNSGTAVLPYSVWLLAMAVLTLERTSMRARR